MISKDLQEQLVAEVENSDNPTDKINEIKEVIYKLSDYKDNPVELVKWVPIDKVRVNEYNPNNVASKELELLYTSIRHDGYTQPIVTVYDEEKDEYVIVDGFHRYFVLKSHKELLQMNKGRVPVTMIECDINDRMASTIRHNRARGKHSVNGMSNVVFRMLDNGWSDAEILEELGMEPDELLRLKHITGFSKLFEDVKYRKSWEHKRQIRNRRGYEKENGES